MFIPSKMLIHEQRVEASPLGPILKTHTEEFYEHHDSEYMRLIFFLMYEMCKGEDSFWAPYFEIA